MKYHHTANHTIIMHDDAIVNVLVHSNCMYFPLSTFHCPLKGPIGSRHFHPSGFEHTILAGANDISGRWDAVVQLYTTTYSQDPVFLRPKTPAKNKVASNNPGLTNVTRTGPRETVVNEISSLYVGVIDNSHDYFSGNSPVFLFSSISPKYRH